MFGRTKKQPQAQPSHVSFGPGETPVEHTPDVSAAIADDEAWFAQNEPRFRIRTRIPGEFGQFEERASDSWQTCVLRVGEGVTYRFPMPDQHLASNEAITGIIFSPETGQVAFIVHREGGEQRITSPWDVYPAS